MVDTKTSFSDIPVGEERPVSFLVASMEERLNSAGNPFLVIKANDASHSQSMLRLWNHGTDDVAFSVGDVITCPITCKIFQDSRTYTSASWELEDPSFAPQFVRCAPLPIDEMWEGVVSFIEDMREPYRSLCEMLIIDNKDAYCHAAAAKNVHHAYVSGLLYHSYRMACTVAALAPLYGADADVAVAGALLHDIGKLAEMDTDPLGIASYTVPGALLGHLYLGCEMVRDAAEKLVHTFEKDELLCLLHIIASHHGTQEHGAIKEPMTKEALLVHEADMLDMNMTVYDEQATEVEPGNVSDARSVIGRVYVPVTNVDEEISSSAQDEDLFPF